MIKAEVYGHKEIEKVLKQLPKKLGKAAMYSAVTSGGHVIAKEIKSRAPVGKQRGHHAALKTAKLGKITTNISRRKIPTRGLKAAQLIGIRARAYWAPWVETGLPPRPAVSGRPGETRTARIGNQYVEISTTGSMPAKPFFWPAVRLAMPRAEKRVLDVIWNRISKQVAILAGSYKKYRKRIL